jgi:hypothetical protein
MRHALKFVVAVVAGLAFAPQAQANWWDQYDMSGGQMNWRRGGSHSFGQHWPLSGPDVRTSVRRNENGSLQVTKECHTATCQGRSSRTVTPPRQHGGPFGQPKWGDDGRFSASRWHGRSWEGPNGGQVGTWHGRGFAAGPSGSARWRAGGAYAQGPQGGYVARGHGTVRGHRR